MCLSATPLSKRWRKRADHRRCHPPSSLPQHQICKHRSNPGMRPWCYRGRPCRRRMSKTSTDATGTAALVCAARQDTHEEATRVLVMRPALALQFRIYLAASLIQMKTSVCSLFCRPSKRHVSACRPSSAQVQCEQECWSIAGRQTST